MKLFNLEAEKVILGSMILENNLIKQIQMKIRADYFYSTENKKIYESIIKLYETYKVVELATLNDFEIDYIVSLISSVLTTANINHYLNIIVDLYIRREIYKATDIVREIVTNENINEIELIKSESLSVINNVKLPDNKRAKRSMVNIVSDALTKLENAHRKGENAYYKWNLNWLQDKTGGMQEAYIVLAARPSIGKTALSLQLGSGIAIQGGKVAIFSLETMEDKLINRLICNRGNIDNKYFRKPELLTPEIWIKLAQTAAKISELPCYIFDDIFYIEEIILKVQELKASESLDMVIIDYLQLIETKKNLNENDRITHVSRQLKILQQTLGLTILVLSQFSRDMEKLKRPPVLSDLRGSGSIEQDATDIWFLHVDPDFEYEISKAVDVQLIIAKQKEGERNIKKTLKFFGNSQRFYEN